jgi:hypothetical protein
LQQTEEILGFPLPEVISVLYTELANGGFGPGYGLRGAVGGYGTVGTVLPKGERWRSDETLVMYHARRDGHLVDLHRYASRWQEEGRRRWLELPADGFPLQCFPICSLGCDQEVVVNTHGHVFYWGPAEEKDMFTFSDRRMSFEQWMWMLLKNYPDAIYTFPA